MYRFSYVLGVYLGHKKCHQGLPETSGLDCKLIDIDQKPF